MAAYDVTSDKQFRVLTTLRKRVEFPEFSKEAAVREDELKGLPDDCFAWPEKRAFPIDSKANTYLSTAYFMTTATAGDSSIPGYVYDNLEKAAAIFELENDLAKVASSFKRKPTPVAKSSDFGLFYKQAGRTVAKYPMLDGDMVKSAAAHFNGNYHSYPVEHQRTIADNILIKAAKFGVRITEPAVFQCSGCSATVDLGKAINEVEKRAYRNKNTPYGAMFEKVSKDLRKVSAHDIQGIRKLQDTVYQMDKQAGLDQYYGRHYENPLQLMYDKSDKMDYLFKTAEETVMLANSPVALASLIGVPPSLYEDVLGLELKTELMTGDALDPMKVKAVLPTLPLPEATFLKSQLVAAGVA